MKVKLTLLMSSLVVLFSCKTTKDISELTDNDIKIEMTRGACFGKCPIYTIKVYEGGYTTLDATRFTKRVGKFSKQLSKKQYKSLVNDFDSANLYQYPEMFESDLVDLPLISFMYRGDQGKKIVRGRDERPQDLKNLQYKLETIYDEEGWKLIKTPDVLEEAPVSVFSDGPEAEPRPVYDQSKIIIKPKPGTRLPLVFKEMEKYGVRLVTRISEDQNLWLVTYNTADIDAADMLTAFKNHPGIESAQYDQVVQQRDR